MGSISIVQWRKSYMLEFLENGEVRECFTFAVPPESEELQFSQRISETKTFGGSVFDDYGNDSYKITLTGTTVNDEKKLIYKGGSLPPQYLTGTKEIFELQKIIKDWSDGTYTGGFFRKSGSKLTSADRKVYLYDLSKMSLLQIASGTASRNYWRVFIKDLKIKRDKSKPRTYSYTLEMTGVEEEAKGGTGFLGTLSDTVDSIQNAMDCVQTVMDITEASTAALNRIAQHCAEVKKAYETVKNRDISAGLVVLNIGSAVDLVSRIMGGDSNTFYNSAKNTLEAVTIFKGLGSGNGGETKSGRTENTSIYKVFFETDGGSPVKTQTVEFCKTASKPADPEKDKYAFDGWYADAALENAYSFSNEITETTTIYAKWKLAVATVSYNSRNGSRVQPQDVAVGSTTTPPTPPTRKGYVFSRWCTNYDCTVDFDFSTPIDADITLYAAWRETCTVDFDTDGGSEVGSQIIGIGDLVIYPLTPAKDNYTFAQWCIRGEAEIETGEVDGDGNPVMTTGTVYTGFDFATPVKTDLTLYARYVHISNTVSFDSMGGSQVESQRIAIGGYAAKPDNPVKDGYDFICWCTDIDCTNEYRFGSWTVTENIVLYAKWTESVCTVVFDTDGGSVIADQEVPYNGRAVFPAVPEKENCVFEMWQTKAEDEETGETVFSEFDFATTLTAGLTLYAKWFGGIA